MRRGRLQVSLFVIFVLISTGTYAAGNEGVQFDKPGVHLEVRGVISKIASGILFVKTSWGTMTVAPDSDLKGIKVGEEVNVWVNENNTVIDVHRKGNAGLHRLLTGKLTWASADKKEIKIWTPEGEKTYPVSESSLLANLKEGTLITVELDEGRVIDVHKSKKGIHLGFRENVGGNR